MPANIDPIYSGSGLFAAVAVTAANTSSQGGGTIGTDIFLVFTAGANGNFLREVRWLLGESTIATASTATVGRLFLSSQSSGSTTSANTHLLQEIALASQTPSSTVPGLPIVMPLNIIVPTGYSLLATCHAAPAAATQWKAMAFGGAY